MPYGVAGFAEEVAEACASSIARDVDLIVSMVSNCHGGAAGAPPKFLYQVAVRLLRLCCAPRFTHLARALPPDTVRAAAKRVDNAVFDGLWRILRLPDGVIPPADSRDYADLRLLVALPADLGGLGLGGVERMLDAAFFAGVASSVAFLRRAMPGVIDDGPGLRRHMPAFAAVFDRLTSGPQPIIVGDAGRAPDFGAYIDNIVAAGVGGSARGLQRQLMDDVNQYAHSALCDRSDTDALRRILGGTGRGAGAWVHAAPSSWHFQLPNSVFYLAVLKRLGLRVVPAPGLGPQTRRCAACVQRRRDDVARARALRAAGADAADPAGVGSRPAPTHEPGSAPVGAKRRRALSDGDDDGALADPGASDSGSSLRIEAAVRNNAVWLHDPAGWHADLCKGFGKAHRAHLQAAAFAASITAGTRGSIRNRVLGSVAHPTQPALSDVPNLRAVPSVASVAKGTVTRFDVAWRDAASPDAWFVCDLVVKSPHSVRNAAYTEGMAVAAAEAEKVRHYTNVIANFSDVRPRVLFAAVDTYGRFGKEFDKFIQDEAARIFAHDTDGLRSLWTTQFRQRMSCALQKGNAGALEWFRDTAWTPDATAAADSARLARVFALAPPSRYHRR
jgi:hypothetical protein